MARFTILLFITCIVVHSAAFDLSPSRNAHSESGGWREKALRYKTRVIPGFRVRLRPRFEFRTWLSWHPRRQNSDVLWRRYRHRLYQALKCQSLPRTHTGRCNNVWYPRWGSAGTPLLVLAGAPRSRTPSGGSRRNPRVISNIISRAATHKPSARGLSELAVFFGQLLDHTITKTSTVKGEQMSFKVPFNDKRFPPGAKMSFSRSRRVWTRTLYADGYAPVNELSSYIDASSVYGTRTKEAHYLRSWSGGRLRTGLGRLMPRGKGGFFESGEGRANENPGLQAMHTLLVREHNRLCTEVSRAFPKYNDNQLYALARRVLIAELQAAVFFDYVPAMVGRALPAYRGYEASTDATIAVEFSTVGFRVGHSLISPAITLLSGGKRRRVPLRRAFFNPWILKGAGAFDAILRGMLRTRASEVDVHVTDDVRNFLVGGPGHTVRMDLCALNIQRGRDQAVLAYNDMRALYGLRRVGSFSDMASNETLARALHEAYKGNVDDMDPWIGGLAEEHVSGGSLGPLFSRIWIEQFTRLRDGDRFYFQRPGAFSEVERRRMPTVAFLMRPGFNGGAMRRLIRYNSGLRGSDVSKDPFFVQR